MNKNIVVRSMKFDSLNDGASSEAMNVQKIFFSETEEYLLLHKKIVDNSFNHLEKNYKQKSIYKIIFVSFFLSLLVLQFIWIRNLIIVDKFSDVTISIVVTGFFVETIGIIGIMVSNIFSSDSEIETLKSIQAVASGYKRTNQ